MQHRHRDALLQGLQLNTNAVRDLCTCPVNDPHLFEGIIPVVRKWTVTAGYVFSKSSTKVWHWHRHHLYVGRRTRLGSRTSNFPQTAQGRVGHFFVRKAEAVAASRPTRVATHLRICTPSFPSLYLEGFYRNNPRTDNGHALGYPSNRIESSVVRPCAFIRRPAIVGQPADARRSSFGGRSDYTAAADFSSLTGRRSSFVFGAGMGSGDIRLVSSGGRQKWL